MVTTDPYRVIYWDASAGLSVIFQDSHSDSARALAQRRGFHLVSTLAYTETCAVIARIAREGILKEPPGPASGKLALLIFDTRLRESLQRERDYSMMKQKRVLNYIFIVRKGILKSAWPKWFSHQNPVENSVRCLFQQE